jgi:hypothetical protein
VIGFILLLLTALCALPAVPDTSSLAANASSGASLPIALKAFVQDHVRKIDREIDQTTKLSFAFVDLNGDGTDEVIVHMTGRSWCGTGGCITYVLTRSGGTYRFVARIPATRPPIRVLNKTRYGWHSVSTIVRDDATHVYEGELRFNGQKYPIGQTPVRRNVPGRVVISGDEKEISLFP